MLLLKIDKNLDKHRSNNEQDEHKDRDESSQQALLSSKGIADDSHLNLVNKMLPPKWFTKVKIVVSHDYHFNVIAMIDWCGYELYPRMINSSKLFWKVNWKIGFC